MTRLAPGDRIPALPRGRPPIDKDPEEVGVLAASTLWVDDRGQDIAEDAVMLAAILVIVIGTIRLVGSNANLAFSSAASALQ